MRSAVVGTFEVLAQAPKAIHDFLHFLHLLKSRFTLTVIMKTRVSELQEHFAVRSRFILTAIMKMVSELQERFSVRVQIQNNIV